MKHRRLMTTGAVAGVCAIAGAVAGIAGSAAAPAGKKAGANASEKADGHRGGHFGPRFGMFGGPPVHSEAVVPNKAGNGFEKVTTDHGAFKSLSSNQLTITDGTKTAKYQDVTLTIPANATIRRNDAKAQLSDLKTGDQVSVLQSSQGTFVSAEDAQHQVSEGPGHGGPHGGPPGGPPGGPDGGPEGFRGR